MKSVRMYMCRDGMAPCTRVFCYAPDKPNYRPKGCYPVIVLKESHYRKINAVIKAARDIGFPPLYRDLRETVKKLQILIAKMDGRKKGKYENN